jgi:uncharacterized cupredoxin-like copper-binding protein
MMRKQLATLVLVAGAGLATACGATAATGGPAGGAAARAPTGAAGAQQVTVAVGNSTRFAPSSIVVGAGQPVEQTLRDGGAIAHDFAPTEGASRPVTTEARRGQTARGAFTIDAPGTYAFVGSVPGHAAAGMKGTVTAQ